MRTPKIEALHRCINWLNVKINYNIPLLNLDKSPLGNSSWLSGILEADCSFYFNYKLNEKIIPVGILYYLRLSQKQSYDHRTVAPKYDISNKSFMQLIADFLSAELITIEKDRKYYIEKAYEVRTHRLAYNTKLLNYFNDFPLFGYKYFTLINIAKIHNLIINKKHKLEEGKKEFIEYTKYLKYDNKIHTPLWGGSI